MMTLADLLTIVGSDYIIGVNKGTELIEEFTHIDTGKRVKYRDAMVTGVHVLNEDTLAINIEID